MNNQVHVQVRRVIQETAEVRSFELAAVNGQVLPAFSAGAHIDVHLPGNVVRQYSLCNGPDDKDCYVIGVKRETASRGGSSALHEKVKKGDFLQVSAPRNNFALVPKATHHLLLGAGIGITPLLSMARHLAADGTSFELHYFARSSDLVAFHEALEHPKFKGKVHFHLGLDAAGVQATLERRLAERTTGAHLYLCGPRPFMQVVRDCATKAWPTETVHFEYFSADETVLSAPKESFTVRLARSGGEYTIPADQSIVQVLGTHGIEIFTSCEQGVCGSCVTNIVEGAPDHRDSFLTDDEKRCGNKMMPCVSRSCSNVLILDL